MVIKPIFWKKSLDSKCSLATTSNEAAFKTLDILFPKCRVLLNLRTSQPFEEVLEDLGQVLKMSGAKRMFTPSGQEVSIYLNCSSIIFNYKS